MSISLLDYQKQTWDIKKETSEQVAQLDEALKKISDSMGSDSENNEEDFKYIKEFSERYHQTKTAIEEKINNYKYSILIQEIMDRYLNGTLAENGYVFHDPVEESLRGAERAIDVGSAYYAQASKEFDENMCNIIHELIHKRDLQKMVHDIKKLGITKKKIDKRWKELEKKLTLLSEEIATLIENKNHLDDKWEKLSGFPTQKIDSHTEDKEKIKRFEYGAIDDCAEEIMDKYLNGTLMLDGGGAFYEPVTVWLDTAKGSIHSGLEYYVQVSKEFSWNINKITHALIHKGNLKTIKNDISILNKTKKRSMIDGKN